MRGGYRREIFSSSSRAFIRSQILSEWATSVLGGYFDAEWQDATRELWREMDSGKCRFVTSETTVAEIEDAPLAVRSGFNAVNLLRGYPPIRIVAPLQLLHANDPEDL